MKHSWTDLFSNDGEYLMCLLPLEVTDHLTFARVGVEGAVAELEKWGSEFTGEFFFLTMIIFKGLTHVLKQVMT